MGKLTNKEITEQEIELYYFYRKEGLTKGYFMRYFQKLKTSRTNSEAYQEVNEEYFNLFGEMKYSNYDSFRKILANYLKS